MSNDDLSPEYKQALGLAVDQFRLNIQKLQERREAGWLKHALQWGLFIRGTQIFMVVSFVEGTNQRKGIDWELLKWGAIICPFLGFVIGAFEWKALPQKIRDLMITTATIEWHPKFQESLWISNLGWFLACLPFALRLFNRKEILPFICMISIAGVVLCVWAALVQVRTIQFIKKIDPNNPDLPSMVSIIRGPILVVHVSVLGCLMAFLRMS